jgi:Recombinase
MAAEYSRELGVRCYEAQRRLAQMGFRVGGACPYGWRRMLLSEEGKKVRILQKGEYKSLSTDRVILVPGPKREVETVRKIFALLLGGTRPADIACQLNRERIKYLGDAPWNFYSVSRILRSLAYTGTNVWGQSSRQLHSKNIELPRNEWICAPNAFTPIVDQKTYQRAQKILDNTTQSRSNEVLLNDLKRLLQRKGHLSMTLIEEAPKLASLSCYHARFGPLRNIYRLVGYDPRQEYFRRSAKARITHDMRKDLMDAIVAEFPDRVTLRKDGRKHRCTLVVDGLIVVSVVLCRLGTWPNGKSAWRYYPTPTEARNITLLCTMNGRNDGVDGYYLFGDLGRPGTYRFGRTSKWLQGAVHLNSLSQFCGALGYASTLAVRASASV